MDKTISQLHADKHFSVDLSDQPMSLFVDGESRLVFLDEGAGENRINGAVLLPDRHPRFVVRSTEKGDAVLEIEYCERRFTVGTTTTPVATRNWATAVNALLASKVSATNLAPILNLVEPFTTSDPPRQTIRLDP